jgi:hypothetical protein
MGPLSCVQSVVDRNVIMQRMTVQNCCVCVCVSKANLRYILSDIYQSPCPVISLLTLMYPAQLTAQSYDKVAEQNDTVFVR